MQKHTKFQLLLSKQNNFRAFTCLKVSSLTWTNSMNEDAEKHAERRALGNAEISRGIYQGCRKFHDLSLISPPPLIFFLATRHVAPQNP